MRNFSVIWVLLGLAFFCQGFSVAPRTGRRPSCLQSDELKERVLENQNPFLEFVTLQAVLVLENEIKHNEKSYEGLKGNDQRLSAKIDGVYDKLSAKIDKGAAENKADFDKLAEKFDKVSAEIKAEFDKLSTKIDDVAMKSSPYACS